ncbi:hypothetical protein GL297_13250 [Komagataeibacter sp. FXV2]|nr:hypothetical protein [Komagataeibacter sp. FXV2]
MTENSEINPLLNKGSFWVLLFFEKGRRSFCRLLSQGAALKPAKGHCPLETVTWGLFGKAGSITP